jgi:hypothetical protein
MNTDRHASRTLQTPLAALERALMETYVQGRGFDPETLDDLPDAERIELLKDASIAVSSKLAEIEARSQYVHDLHH